jgi:hypothetical protein
MISTIPGGSPHALHLFDSADSRRQAIATLVRAARECGDRLLIVMRLEEWNRVASELPRDEVCLSDALRARQLTVLDAAATLSSFLREGIPDATLFESAVGDEIRRLTADGHALRIYGDMVDLLAHDGNFDAAARLETLWNDLQARVPFTLLCGYSAAHFSERRDLDALTTICRLHAQVSAHPDDVLGTGLLEATALRG